VTGSGIPADEVLPCGCLIRCTVVDGVNTLTISPCRTDCRNLANALELGREKGIAPEFRRAP
jgi:hypothetical protein